MKEEGRKTYGVLVSMFMICSIIFSGIIPLNVLAVGQLPFYDIEQDSAGNYHKAFIDNSTGNYEIYYTNDIGGDYPQDWNTPIRITNSSLGTTTDSLLLDLGIYLVTDTMFIIWNEDMSLNVTTPVNVTYYTLSRDYGANWTEPEISFEKVILKYAEFDPLVEEPTVPSLPQSYADPYAYYIVQLKTPMIQEWWDGIESEGGVFCGYIPSNAYIVCMTPSVKDQVEQLPYIRWIHFLHPLFKIQDSLFSKTGTIGLNIMVIEETGGQANLDKVITEIVTMGGVIISDGTGSYIIRAYIDADKIEDLAYVPEVKWMDEITQFDVDMDIIRAYTGTDTVHLDGFSGEDIIGGLFDIGLDQTHPDFAGQIEDTYPAIIPVKAHGTCTFGILFSNDNGDAKGMLPDATGIFTDAIAYESDFTTAYENQDDSGSVFVCMSGGHGYTYEYTSYSNELDSIVRDLDITSVNAMGNHDGAGMRPEAVAKNVIAVGGVNHQGTETYNDDQHGPYLPYLPNGASTGPPLDNPIYNQGWWYRYKPDLSAPYDRIYTTDSTVFTDDTGQDGYDDSSDYYDSFGGTSGGSAVVSGAVGLAYEMYVKNHFGSNPQGLEPHASTLKALLIANAHQYDLTQVNRYEQGWGMVDIGMVNNVGSKHVIINEDVSLQQGESFEITVSPVWHGRMKVTLVWTDPPSVPLSGSTRVNDLDLYVQTDMDSWSGNQNMESMKYTKNIGYPKDYLNNVENVFIEDVYVFDYAHTIKVRAAEISEDGNLDTPEIDQHFALVVSYEPYYQEIELYPGWNLISLPEKVSPTKLEIVLKSIGNNYDLVQYYDAFDTSDPWKHWNIYKEPYQNDLKELDNLMGFYVHIINTVNPIFMKAYWDDWRWWVNQKVPIALGWNMVGFPAKNNEEFYYALNNLQWGIHIDLVQYYDAPTQSTKNGQGLDFVVGRGYWFHIIQLPTGNHWVVPRT